MLGDGYLSFWGILLPFLDNANLYNSIDLTQPVTSTTAVNNGIINNNVIGTNAATVGKASLPAYHCPSRRGSDVSTGGRYASMSGPTGDYAVVIWYANDGNGTQQGTNSNDSWWNLHGRGLDQNLFSAIRTATVVDPATSNRVFSGLGNTTNGWAPRDSFAKITDGTSNTIIIGEKHITQNEIGKCCDNGDYADGNIYYQVGNWGEYTVGRQIRGSVPFAPYKTYPDSAAQTTAFGSWHDGMAQFLLADGSVRAISSNIDTNLFRNLGHASDGNVIGDF